LTGGISRTLPYISMRIYVVWITVMKYNIKKTAQEILGRNLGHVNVYKFVYIMHYIYKGLNKL